MLLNISLLYDRAAAQEAQGGQDPFCQQARQGLRHTLQGYFLVGEVPLYTHAKVRSEGVG
jgi:hypothetical protein